MPKSNRKNGKANTKVKDIVLVILLLLVVLCSIYLKFGDEIIDVFNDSNNSSQENLHSEEVVILPTEVPENHDDNIDSGVTVQNDSGYTESQLSIYFFDVGQADSILLMTDDKVMLIDTGNAGDADNSFKLQNKINLSHELNRLGITTIDYLIATHPHEDHMGSMYKIINLFDVKNLYANKILPEEEWTNYYRRFVTALESSNTHLITPTTYSDEELITRVDEYNSSVTNENDKIVFNPNDYFRVGDTIPFGNAIVTILGPNSENYSDTNDYSIVIMVEFEGVKILLTGDAGKIAENEIISYSNSVGLDLDADVLKVGHHGSRTANTEDFISLVKPEYAVIMVSEDNSYGLPDEDVIERLENHGATIYMTKDVGDILLVVDDGTYEFDLDFSHEEKEAK